jgi:hypothetical protein
MGLRHCPFNNCQFLGKGIPANYIPHRGNYNLPNGILPSADSAVQMYESSAGGHLTMETNFGADPLEGNNDRKVLRDQCFWFEIETRFGGLNNLANNLANHQHQPFHEALMRLIELGIAFS